MADAQVPQTQADEPATGDRGWRGLAREDGEREAFLGVLVLLALVVLATILGGLPGLFISYIVLTVAMMVVLVVISVGS